jgi:hypothetical protein
MNKIGIVNVVDAIMATNGRLTRVFKPALVERVHTNALRKTQPVILVGLTAMVLAMLATGTITVGMTVIQQTSMIDW